MEPMMDTRTSSTQPAVSHQVLSAVSHELRGPLGVARGYLRMLTQSESLDPRVSKMVADALRATDRMGELLDEVSEFARWVRGEHALAQARVPLGDITVAAAKMAPMPTHAQVRVEVNAPGDVTAEADAAQLTRACAALIAATARSQIGDATIIVAVHAGNQGRPVVRIAPGDWLEAAVERPPALERAGAGLSIAMADLIVKRHGGLLVERWASEVWAGYEVRV